MSGSTGQFGPHRRSSRTEADRQMPRAPLGKGQRVTLSRVDAKSHATIGKLLHGWMKDLSLGGMFIESDAELAPEQEVEVRTLMRHGDAAFQMKLRGWVVHRQLHGFGLQLAPPAAEEKEVLQSTIDRVAYHQS